METKLKKLVLEGFYHEAENVMLTIPLNAQRDIIMNLAYDTESIAIYGFLRYMLEKNKRPIKTVPFGLTANLQQ